MCLTIDELVVYLYLAGNSPAWKTRSIPSFNRYRQGTRWYATCVSMSCYYSGCCGCA
jgi:hypothetical protein